MAVLKNLSDIEYLILISNVNTFKEDKCLIPQLKLSLQGMTITGYQRVNRFIYRFT